MSNIDAPKNYDSNRQIHILTASAAVSGILYLTGILWISFNPVKIQEWPPEIIYHAVYYLLIIIAFFIVSRFPQFHSYRHALLVFLAVGFTYLTQDMGLNVWASIYENYLKSVEASETMRRIYGDDFHPSGAPILALLGNSMLIVAWIIMIVFVSKSLANK